MNWTTRLWLVLVVLAVAVSALFLLPKSRPETRIYIAGVDHSPPYYWVEPSGGVHGMAVEVFDEAARRIGIQLQWKPITESLDTALETHSVDLWPVVSITEERKRRVHLTEPWLANRFALLTLATSGIQTPEQLAGKKLAHLSFPRTRALAERFFPRSVRIEKPTRERAVEAVCEGEAAASFSEIRHIDALMLDRPKSCVGKAWSVLFVPGATVPMGIAAHASAAKAADSLRAEIIRMALGGDSFSADGAMVAILGHGDSIAFRALGGRTKEPAALLNRLDSQHRAGPIRVADPTGTHSTPRRGKCKSGKVRISCEYQP